MVLAGSFIAVNEQQEPTFMITSFYKHSFLDIFLVQSPRKILYTSLATGRLLLVYCQCASHTSDQLEWL